jgi:hypothetical protein
MQENIETFIQHVREVSQNPDFVHHTWFVKYHLEIVERIAMELCEIYTDADRDFVRLLVWLHDYGKILNFDNQYTETLVSGKAKLEEIGFDQEIVGKAIQSMEIIDRKNWDELESATIEIKIISSADGASHHVGPFFALWWYENAHKNFEELMQDKIDKTNKDWDRKMVLPEVRKAFQARHDFILELNGQLPHKFLNEIRLLD